MGVLKLDELEAMGPPVKGVQKLRLGPREFIWLGRTLRDVEFFNNLTGSELDKLLPAIALYGFPPDCVVISQGAKDDALFVLYLGRVVVSRRKSWRMFSTPIKSLLPGDFFGEIALLDGRPRTATVTTTEPSAMFVLQAQDFRFVLEKNPDLAVHIRQIATDRKFELEQWEKQ